MVLYRVKQIYKDVPPCYQHDKIATLYLSRSKANFNRPFKFAYNLDHDPCSYFKWADQEPDDYTVALNQPNYLPPPSPKKPKGQQQQQKETTPIKVIYLTMRVKRMPQFKRAEGAKEQEKQERQPITAARDHHHRLARQPLIQ